MSNQKVKEAGKEDRYADAFIETVGSVKDEIKDILENYGKEAIGFQYACIIYVEKQIPAGIYLSTKSVSYAAIKTEKD